MSDETVRFSRSSSETASRDTPSCLANSPCVIFKRGQVEGGERLSVSTLCPLPDLIPRLLLITSSCDMLH